MAACPRSALGSGAKNMASARGEVGAGCGDAGLMAVNGAGGGVGWDRRDGFGIVEGGKRRGVVDGFARIEVTGRPAGLRSAPVRRANELRELL